MILSRRRLFGFGVALVAAPSIVRATNLMPISTKPLNVLDFGAIPTPDPMFVVENLRALKALHERPQVVWVRTGPGSGLYMWDTPTANARDDDRVVVFQPH
jgi:hypothetical protein